MDYQKEYIEKNPDLHDFDTKSKVNSIDQVISPTAMKFSSILDVACGSGRILLEISLRYQSEEILGVDISKKMIEIAKNNDVKGRAKWIVSDVFDLKSKNHKLVLAIDILEHVEDDIGLLRHISDLGKFIVIKTPVERNIMNKVVKILSFGLLNEYKYTEKKYGHIHHYSEKDIQDLIDRSDLVVVSKVYAYLPKRSKMFWEILRIMLFPIWWLSKSLYLKINGGFLVILLTKRNGKI